jgi:hypothetical protein
MKEPCPTPAAPDDRCGGKSPDLLTRLLQARRGHPPALRILVLHDGFRARKRAEQLLLRIRKTAGDARRLTCAFQRLGDLRCRAPRQKRRSAELVLLAVGCGATLAPDSLAQVISLLPSLGANRGALAFLSGTHVPRQMDVALIERFLRSQSRQAGVDFFIGKMPGIGCPGCRPPKHPSAGRSAAERFCLLHAPPAGGRARTARLSQHPPSQDVKTPSARQPRADCQLRRTAKHRLPGKRTARDGG